MEVRFVPPELRRLDALRCEALALAFFEDERPLLGSAGLIDWRLSGTLSKLLLRGRLSGARGEVLLLPPRPKLPFDKLFLVGLGPRASFDAAALHDAVATLLSALSSARVRTAAIALPGRSAHVVEAAPAMAAFLAVAHEHPEIDEVTIVEPPAAQREMEPVLEQDRRRSRVQD